MIKVSHEMPLYMLREGYSNQFNDYEYALVHLFEDNPAYYQYYVNSLREGRTVYLDNSIFELSKAFDADRFVYWLKKLAEDSNSTNIVYIIPDVLDDTSKTIENAKDFINRYPSLPGQRMCVMQGETFQGLLDCYTEFRRLNVDVYGVSFNCKAYDNHFPEIQNELERWKKARQNFVTFLYQYDPYRKPKSLHLLGCALPDEFRYYKEYSSFIVSLDTSNPIVHGLLNIKYQGDYGLKEKQSIKLCDLLNIEKPELTIQSTIEYNIREFRRINNL